MASKVFPSRSGLAVVATASGVIAVSALAGSTPGLAQAAGADGTRSIQRDSEAGKALTRQEPAYRTKEERRNAKPLDWNSTIGTPTSRPRTPAEEEALRQAPPGSTKSGEANPDAAEQARKLHPDDWK